VTEERTLPRFYVSHYRGLWTRSWWQVKDRTIRGRPYGFVSQHKSEVAAVKAAERLERKAARAGEPITVPYA
jgi:hypothetical protein